MKALSTLFIFLISFIWSPKRNQMCPIAVLLFLSLVSLIVSCQPVPWGTPVTPSPPLGNCIQNRSTGNFLPCSQQPNCSHCNTSNGYLFWCENGQTIADGFCPTNTCDGIKTGCQCPSALCQNCSNPMECSLYQGRCDPRGFCICEPGYSGNACEQVNVCTGKPDGIHCMGLYTRYTCQNQYVVAGSSTNCTFACRDGYGCSCPNNCTEPSNGQCQPTTTTGICNCNPGYLDDDCSLSTERERERLSIDSLTHSLTHTQIFII